MPSFQVPDRSPSPPSTPARPNETRNLFGFSGPSTTPAGPAPSSAGSFTPHGAPPSSAFGSSQMSFGYSNQPVQPLSFTKNPAPTIFGAPKSNAAFGSFGRIGGASALRNEYKASDYGNDSMDESYHNGANDNAGSEHNNEYAGSQSQGDYDDMASERFQSQEGYDNEMSEMDYEQSLPPLRAGNGATSYGQSDYQFSHAPQETIEDNRMADLARYSRIAMSTFEEVQYAFIEESDEVIVGTEVFVKKLQSLLPNMNFDADAGNQVLNVLPQQLLSEWSKYYHQIKPMQSDDHARAIGPDPSSPSFATAYFLASLAMRLNHPTQFPPQHITPVPRELLDWQKQFHQPYPGQFQDVMATNPSPSHSLLYWATVLTTLIRGNVSDTVHALQNAGWEYARDTDKYGAVGYTGKALENVEKVVDDMIRVLAHSPAYRNEWETKSTDWTLFRVKAQRALDDLKSFAEGRDQEDRQQIAFEAKNFGLRNNLQTKSSYSGLARKAQSKVPWDVYQNLVTMYNVMLGDSTSIFSNSQDWLEATISLSVWWNHGKNALVLEPPMSLARRIHHSTDYMGTVRRALSAVLGMQMPGGSTVNTLNHAELGLACLLAGDPEGAMKIISCYSLPIAYALGQVGEAAGWLQQSEVGRDHGLDLDQDDMDVLQLGDNTKRVSERDATAIAYADELIKRESIVYHRNGLKIAEEGWQLSLNVLTRLSDVRLSDAQIRRQLDGMDLQKETIIEAVWKHLNELGLDEFAEGVAERHADHLSEHTHKYGEALWYYSLAHKQDKVKDVLNLLTSLSLLHSVAYPPTSETDEYLQRLIQSPRAVISQMSQLDSTAAKLLRQMLSGYATLRRFYELRDENVESEGNCELSQNAKAEALSALIAVISSSDDNIRGGLFDEERGAVVDVDFLLALLGEAMVFVDKSPTIITPYQIEVLMKAVEDLETVSERIYSACDEFFNTVLASTHGLKGSNPMDLLKKSTSSLSGASSFSMVGSSMFASQLNKSIGNSGVIIKENAKRGWDWRKGLTAGMTSKDVLRILRYGLAKDLAMVSVMKADGQLW